MDECKLRAASNLHELWWFLLQTCAIILPDDDLIDGWWIGLKKTKKVWESKFEENCRSEKSDVLMQFSVMIRLIYDVLIMFVNHA